jgi:hypothetical protein
MIQTEKATDRWDLPHVAEFVDEVTLQCKCSRFAEHALHRPVKLEKAHEFSTIVTEKGI